MMFDRPIIVCGGGLSGRGGYSGQGVPPRLLRQRGPHFSFGKGFHHNQGSDPVLRMSGPVTPEIVADRGGSSDSSEIFRNGRLAYETWAGRPSNLRWPFEASSSLFARVHLRQKPTRCISNAFQLLRVWVRQHDEQSTTGTEPNAWESHPRIRSTRKCLT